VPRDFAVSEAYVPTILVLFALGAFVTWVLDRILAMTRLYHVVWHPSLFRASMLVCVCSLLGLYVYR
jgi:protein AaeX